MLYGTIKKSRLQVTSGPLDVDKHWDTGYVRWQSTQGLVINQNTTCVYTGWGWVLIICHTIVHHSVLPMVCFLFKLYIDTSVFLPAFSAFVYGECAWTRCEGHWSNFYVIYCHILSTFYTDGHMDSRHVYAYFGWIMFRVGYKSAHSDVFSKSVF